MRNEKDFFKWRSNLRHVTMLLMALFLCVGNAWGADTQYYAQLTVSPGTGGKIAIRTGTGTPSYKTKNTSSSNYVLNNPGGNITFYVWAQASDGYEFDHWAVTTGTASIASSTSAATTVTMAANTAAGTLFSQNPSTATVTAYFRSQVSTVDVTYSMAIVNAQSQETTIAEGVTATYTVTSSVTSGSNYPLNYSYTLGTAPAVVVTSPEEALTLSMPNLPRGYDFLGWYQNSITNIVSNSTQNTNRLLPNQSFTEATTMGAKLLKKTTHGVTFESASNGSYSVTSIADKNNSTIPEDEYDEEHIVGGSAIQIYSDDKITLQATPASGCNFYRWYYRAGTSTRVTLTPTITNTTNDVTTAQVTIPANATAFGAEFRRKVDFQVTSYSSIFTEDDYELGVRNVTKNEYTKLIPETTGTTSFSLLEGEEMTIMLKFATATTRGVNFKRWYCQLGDEKITISAEPEFSITYTQIAAIAAQYPEETILFGVDTELKDTYTIRFVQNQYGPYYVKYYDENSNSSYAYDTGDQFTVAKGTDETPKTLYEGDRIKLEYTSSNENNTTSGYLFHSWYWEDEDGNHYQLGDGVVTVLDTVLTEEAIKLGANFVAVQKGNITFLSNAQGTYKVDAITYGTTKAKATVTVPTSGNSTIQNVLLTSPVKLYKPVCNDPENYAFYRWYYITSENSIPKTLTYLEDSINVVLPENTVSIGMEFQPIGDFSVNGLYFNDLADAIQAAQSEVSKSGSATIVVARDATVGAGNYTIPANVTILIPYKDGQVNPSNLQVIAKTEDYVGAYRTLTLDDGAHLEVYGTIEVSGFQTTGGYDGQGNDVPSRTGGPYYGQMHMNGGSSITMNNGSKLYAWGFVTGDRNANGEYTCEIDVRRGATAYEHFQIADWKGAFPTVEITSYAYENAYHVLPICQYYIQNIEVPARYRPGSRLLGAAAINVDLLDNHNKSYGITFAMNNAGLVGIKYPDDPDHSDNAVFLLNDADNSEDTWVRKFYDPATDQQVYEINNSADVGSLVMYVTIKGIGDVLGRPKNMDNRDRINVDSRAYQFPIMNNFKMHLLSGDMYVTQRTEILPGAVIEIDKKATMTINNNKTNKTPNDIALLFYDAEDWGPYIYQNITSGGQRSWGYGSKVKYRPDGVPNVRNISTKTGQGNSQLIVHGTVDVKGELYTTSHGASITSTIEDAGTIIFSNAAPASVGPTYQVSAISGGNNPTFTAIPRVPALLRNDDKNTAYGATTSTDSTPKDTSYCFIDMNGDGKGEWINLANDGCFVKDQYGTYYAKPQEYVALANGKTANADHTYSDAAGQGRLFILVDDCQWWEVEKKDNLYHCTNPDNDTYYFWDDGDPVESKHKWREKEFFVTWVNWDGSSLRWDGTTEETKYQNHLVYNLNYGIIPKYLEDGNPTRPDDVDYTYNFVGWTPEIDSVKGDATYTAVYEKIQKKYTIIFKDQNDNEIERQQLALGASPSAPDISSISNSYWNPAIAVVSGNATYKVATYTETPTEFTVTWRNYDGSTISSDPVTKDDKPVYSGSTPVKNLNNEYDYTWTGWQSPAGTYDTDDELPAVTANITYTATFSATAKGFDINFYEVDGETPIDGAAQHLAYGATPVAPEYSNPSAEAGYTYSLQWIDMVDPSIVGVNVPTVTRAANYQADFIATINKYAVTLQSEEDSVCTFVGAGLYDYNAASDALTISVNPNAGYKFVRWEVFDGNDYVITDKARTFTTAITADMTYRAIMEAQTDLEIEVNDVTDVRTPMEVNDLILSSNGSESGQLLHSDRLTVNGNCYFDLAINAKNHQWYAVAVPWQVDAQTGISVNGRTLELGKDFDIIYYDGARRANEGKQKCWKYVEDDDNKTLVPGRLYMIGLMGDAPVIRFAKKAGAAILTTSTSVTAYAQMTGVNTDAGWNGVANPALFHAFVNPGVTYGQVYKSDTRDYDPITLSDAKFVVGQGAFVSVGADKAITVSKDAPFSPASAPRNTRTSNVKYEVRLAPAEANYTSRLYIETTDDKETDEYIVGQDLAKIGVSSLVPQMWINRYNEKLCVNTQELQNEKAEYPLGISVPANGEYTISNVNVNEDYTLYLTLNNEAIWNLSDAPYTLDLTKGTTNAYGLRISAKAPQVVTGVDEAVVDAKGETKKVLIDNQVFIIRGNEVYTIDGQLVK